MRHERAQKEGIMTMVIGTYSWSYVAHYYIR